MEHADEVDDGACTQIIHSLLENAQVVPFNTLYKLYNNKKEQLYILKKYK